MAFKITRTADGGIVCKYEGVFTLEENQESRRAVGGRKMEKLKTLSYLIADHTKTTSIDMTPEQIRRMAQSAKAEYFDAAPDLLMAVVVPDDLTFGLGRVWYAHLGEEERVGLFRSREEAEDWVREKL